MASAVVVGAGLFLVPGRAQADDAEPSNYRSEVVSVEPAVAGLEAEIVGGDSFLSMHNASGSVVVVVGYEGEPYLRFGADGVVEENVASPTSALNADRYATAVLPTTRDTTPQWRRVAIDGRWAWHDHRTHWMSPTPPLGLGPGDEVADDVVPVLVDGRRVDIRVVSVWVAAPSRLPVIGGVLSAVVAALLLARRRIRGWLFLVGVAALAAAVAGGWQYWSMPVAARSSLFGIAAPMAAAAALVVGCLGAARGARGRLVVLGALMVGGAQLTVWAWGRREGLTAPVLPTTLPFALDRGLTAFVGVVAVVVVVVGVAGVRSALRVGPDGEQPVDDLGDLLVRQ